MIDTKQHAIPTRPKSARKGRKFSPNAAYDFASMLVGDSTTGAHKIAAAAYKYGREHSKRFTARKISADQTRVWRIA